MGQKRQQNATARTQRFDWCIAISTRWFKIWLHNYQWNRHWLRSETKKSARRCGTRLPWANTSHLCSWKQISAKNKQSPIVKRKKTVFCLRKIVILMELESRKKTHPKSGSPVFLLWLYWISYERCTEMLHLTADRPECAHTKTTRTHRTANRGNCESCECTTREAKQKEIVTENKNKVQMGVGARAP